jgi:serine/threonine protein kinase
MSEHIGPYRKLRIMMTGQTSQIWEVIDDRAGTRFAMKHLLPDYARAREHLALLKNEFDVARSLDHPHIIKMHEMVNHKGTPHVIMELFPHLNLKQQIAQQGPASLATRAQKIIRLSGEALAHFHKQNLIHRDIKPDNFLADDQGEIRLIDFALAQKPRSGLAALFFRNRIQGTRSYMAPEQIRGSALTIQSDLYSFGCTIFELLAGKPPFAGLNEAELLQKHLSAPVPNVLSSNDNVTQEFAGLVYRMMAKNPKERPESTSRMMIEIRNMRVFRKKPEGAIE